MNLSDLFAIAEARDPEATAIECETAGGIGRVSYRDLFDEARSRASGLRERGLRRGDRVVFFLSNRREWVTSYLAVIRLGAVMVPVNLAYRRREIAHILADSQPRFIVTETDRLSEIDEALASESAPVEAVLNVDSLDDFSSSRAENAPNERPIVHGHDPAMILYTSGTTGRSKGAVISHDNVLATVTGLLAAWSWRSTDRLLLTLPLFHTHGLVVGLHCALAAGATVLLRKKFEASRTLALLTSQLTTDPTAGAPTLFFGVPTLYTRLITEMADLDTKPDLSSMRLFCSGSAPLPAEVLEAFEEATGHRILERYGMTETGMLFSNPYVGERRAGTVGTPLPGVTFRIVDDEGAEVASGEEGELIVRGSNVFSGYWRAPEKTAESFLTDDEGRRWFKTGDLARQDADPGSGTAYVTLLGRRHELIISGGYNIYPREIEEVLLTLPCIREAAVVGRPHPEWGEVPVAFVVADRSVDEAAMIETLKTQLAGFKVPRRFVRLDELPRNALGKVQKHLLPQ